MRSARGGDGDASGDCESDMLLAMNCVHGSLDGCQDGAALCVLASGSAGNCSVLAIRRRGVTRVCLIDLGLSPRRTMRLLAERGLGAHQIDECFLTHLDADHLHPGWAGAMPRQAVLRLHERHADELGSRFAPGVRVAPFRGDFAVEEGVRVRPRLMAHDELGVSVLRIDLHGVGAGSLGFATDLGRVTPELVEHFRQDGGVEVLAIESNYCPRMQVESDRPDFLKNRIMGGSGHLSNQEAAEAIRAVQPRDHVVLLHLSRQCNDPEVVSGLHAGAEYGFTIASQERATRWIRIGPARRAAPSPARTSSPAPALAAGTLFSMMHEGATAS